jgi:hypothetical protein
MTIAQEASAPSSDEIRTLFLPERATVESSAKSAFGRQVVVVHPFGIFPSTSSNEGLTMADWLWAKEGVTLWNEGIVPQQGMSIRKAQTRPADKTERVSFMVYPFFPAIRKAPFLYICLVTPSQPSPAEASISI